MNLSIAIMIYVSQKTASRSAGVFRTWFNPSCMLLVSSQTHRVKNAVSIEYNGDDYPYSVTVKAVLGLQLLWNTFPNRSFYGVCGDDTMVDTTRLLKKLARMDVSPEKPYVLGQAMTGTEYQKGAKKPTRVFGGAPIILTKESTRWHNHITRARPHVWRRSMLPHDLWLGHLFTKHNPSARIVHIPGLYSQPPWFYRVFPSEREGGISEKSMSFHYLNEREMFWIWPLWKSKTPTCGI